MTSTPHDALFKTIFGQPEHAAAELQHVLPRHLSERVDWSTLALGPGTYVDEALADQHSDLLFSARARASGEPLLVYVLFEHQSTSFSPHVASWAPGTLPDFEYSVDDVHKTSDHDLQTRSIQDAGRVALWLLRDARDRDALLARLPAWAGALEALAHTTAGKNLLAVLLRYIALVSRDLHLTEFRASLRGRAPTAEAVAMTIAEQLLAEGRAQGKAEGRAQGKAEAVLVLLRARGLHVPADVQLCIEACNDADTLDHWLLRAASVSDAADVFEG